MFRDVERSREEIRREALVVLGLLVLSFVYRMPALLNADAVNSDSAMVGLQARHMLRGEWSPYLLGSSYQTSVDSAVAALAFFVLGATPLALMLSAFGGHLVVTFAAYGMARRSFDRVASAMLVLPLVFAPASVHSFALYPPREASLAIAFVSWWGLHVAPKASRPRAAFFVGGLLFALSVYADPYALLFVPATFALVAFATRESGLRSGAFALVGALVGTIPTIVLWRRPEAAHGTASLSFDVLAHNWAIFRDVAFPWGTSAVAYAKGEHVLAWEVHPFGFGFRVVQVVGAVLFVGLTIAGGVLAFAKTTTSEVRRLGVTGLVLFVSTIGGFLVSRMVMDLFSTRYLAALVLAVPLAWAPVLAKLGLDRTFALAAPYVVASAVAGWVAFSPFVDGPRWVHAQASRDERELADILASKRVTIGVADYWTAYRFAFLADERVKLVPIHAREDRYAPWRGEFGSALSFVYVFDPERSRESFEEQRSGWLSGAARYELLHVGSLRAVIVDRNPHRPEGHSP